MREGRLDEMPDCISDDLLAAVAVSQADGDVADLIVERYAGDLVQRVLLYEPVAPGADETAMRDFVARVTGRNGGRTRLTI